MDVLKKVFFQATQLYRVYLGRIPTIGVSLFGRSYTLSRGLLGNVGIILILVVITVGGYCLSRVVFLQRIDLGLLQNKGSIIGKQVVSQADVAGVTTPLGVHNATLEKVLPKPDFSKLSYEQMDMPNVMALGAVPLIFREYEMGEDKLWSEKAKYFNLQVRGAPENIDDTYEKQLASLGWKVEKTQNNAVAMAIKNDGVNNRGVQYYSFNLSKGSDKYSVNIAPVFSGAIAVSDMTQLDISYIPDYNILYRNQPSISEVPFPPIPDGTATWKGNQSYHIEGTSYSPISETFHFTASGSLDSVAQSYKSSLEAKGWTIEGKKNSNVTAVGIVGAENLSNWYFTLSSGTHRFGMNLSGRLPFGTGTIVGKTIVTLNTNLPTYKKDIDYFVMTGSVFGEIPFVKRSGDIFTSFSTMQARDNMKYTYDTEQYLALPEPIVFASEKSFQKAKSELQEDMKKLGYTIESPSTDEQNMIFRATKANEHIFVQMYSPIPTEYSAIFSGSVVINMSASLQ